MFPQETMGSKRNIVVYSIIAVLILGAVGYLWYQNSQKIPEDANVLGEEANIVVTMPKARDRVGLPVVIEGQARVFENVVNYRLVGNDGKILAEGYAMADAPDIGQFGPFRGELMYASETDGEGVVEVFVYSAKDGSEIDKVTIPVTYTKTPEFIKG